MLTVIYAGCCIYYAECYYGECRSADCRGATGRGANKAELFLLLEMMKRRVSVLGLRTKTFYTRNLFPCLVLLIVLPWILG